MYYYLPDKASMYFYVRDKTTGTRLSADLPTIEAARVAAMHASYRYKDVEIVRVTLVGKSVVETIMYRS